MEKRLQCAQQTGAGRHLGARVEVGLLRGGLQRRQALAQVALRARLLRRLQLRQRRLRARRQRGSVSHALASKA
jgi:hypothetical protein